jgi:hypothetical protein
MQQKQNRIEIQQQPSKASLIAKQWISGFETGTRVVFSAENMQQKSNSKSK